ncbi:MAG TPA: uroporphyrinogen-III C-methyltransferase [Solirubrobacterales bacterium]|nr:uroporphyrinogen-III C-methyltransferase [Solirubrobacterales bacterium]
MTPERKSRVYLVGAGPGDPGLMTARALELIALADVIYYDRLIPPTALDGARDSAELVYVGKQPGVPSVPQEEIVERLIESGREGLNVVRLKGGDPYLFGRGAEEAEGLRAAGLDFEVVPGVTAGIAATAYAGIPVTHREDASAVAFVTGHEDPAKPETALDWPALAAFPGTLVFYMGVKRLAANAAALIAAGRPGDQPAAAIQQGTTPSQRVVTATLGTIADAVAEAEIKAPALIVIGDVVKHRESLKWFENRPLHGRKVVVTRARSQASGFAGRLRLLGAEVVEIPAIRIEPLIESAEVEHMVGELSGYGWICLTSPNGAHLLFDAMARRGLDSRALAGVKIAVIGPGTARAVAEHGIKADVIPERFVAESLVEALGGFDLSGRPVLIARAEEARDILPEALTERGADVRVLPLYRTVRETPSRRELAAAEGADWITFTSASSVKNLAEAMPDGPPAGARLVSIGPVTSAAARELGLEVAVEASRHDLDGLLEALLADQPPVV